MSPLEALKEACPIRLRPVVMTSVATLAAAIPPALAMGPGAETRIPMAIAVIGGLLVSTILTLFVVPTAYLWLVPLEKKETTTRFFESLKGLRWHHVSNWLAVARGKLLKFFVQATSKFVVLKGWIKL